MLPAYGTAVDGNIGFATDFGFDWNESSGTGGTDFVGVAEHEITHALGRVSGSDLDLFSYSAPGVPERTGYSGTPYFSVDGGTTDLDHFDTTSDPADWASGTGPDSFDAYSSGGVVNPITTTDTMLLSVLGYDVACFASGTHIRTTRGEIAVENLSPGDRVLSVLRAAPVPVIWVGRRRVACDRHPRPELVWPVRVAADAFGDKIPLRDLFLSPDHAVFADGVLIPIKHLINGRSIAQVAIPRVEYWHVELARHDVVLAEGLAAETYLDTGNRSVFTNGADHLRLHPDFAPLDWENACAELVQDGPRLVTVKARLFRRARLVEGAPVPELRVRAGRRELKPARTAQGWRYTIPAGMQRLSLISPSVMPASCHATSLDRRLLGVRLLGLTVDGVAQALDSPMLATGFYPPEATAEGDCRWTDGSATLALPEDARDLILRVGDGAMTGPWRRSRETAHPA